MEKFAVVMYKPVGYLHIECLREVAETVHYGLLKLGYDSILEVGEKLIFPDRRVILFGAHLLKGQFLPTATIIYNLEQNWENSLLWLFRRHTVWDYSEDNIKRLKELDVEAKYAPIGYVEEMTRIEQWSEDKKDIDVLFYGSMNDRRQKILNELKEKGLKVEYLFGIYGKERDSYIARSKIILNMHFYKTMILETPRISYLLANRCFVISETSSNEILDVKYSPGLLFSRYENLVNTCSRILEKMPNLWCGDIGIEGFNFIASQPETEILKGLLS